MDGSHALNIVVRETLLYFAAAAAAAAAAAVAVAPVCRTVATDRLAWCSCYGVSSGRPMVVQKAWTKVKVFVNLLASLLRADSCI